MRPTRPAVLALFVSLALAGVALGYNLTIANGRRHAQGSVALIARYVPRTTGYRLGPCRRTHTGRVRCPYTLSIRALSGGTITCTSTVQVRWVFRTVRKHRRVIRKVVLISGFPVKPKCVRKPPPRHRATEVGGG